MLLRLLRQPAQDQGVDLGCAHKDAGVDDHDIACLRAVLLIVKFDAVGVKVGHIELHFGEYRPAGKSK